MKKFKTYIEIFYVIIYKFNYKLKFSILTLLLSDKHLKIHFNNTIWFLRFANDLW